jgi:tetratricopeptide (TPR) repeat protein
MVEIPVPEKTPHAPIEAALERAIAAHRAGDLTEAERQYRLVLALDDRCFDALHLLGIVCAQRGDFALAEQLIRAALTVKPDHADAHYNLGNVQRELKQYDAALDSYERAIAQRSDYAAAHANRGIALFELGRFAAALASYDRALALAPDDAEICSNRGNAFFKLNLLEEALASHDRAIALKPDYADAHLNRGSVLLELKQTSAALSSYERAIAVKPDSAVAYCHRGIAFGALARWAQAIASYDRAIALKPDYFDAHANRGHTLMQLGDCEAALSTYQRMIAINPSSAEARYGRGAALYALNMIDEALADFERAIMLKPDYAKAHHNLALLRLLKGDLERGWEEFEWRWTNKDLSSTKRDFQKPSWRGEEDLTGRTILLYGEQGFGDAIQFCRYLPLVAQKGAKIVLQVAPALKELMQSVGGAPNILGFDHPLSDFDCHCPLLSLPLAFKTRLETIPGDVPYLSPPPSCVEKWKTRLPTATGPRIGLVWAGNPKHGNDYNRSIGLQRMLPLLSGARARFFSLQRDLREGDAELLQESPGLVHLGDELATFGDTAAIVSQLDLVISVDTSVVHLAGALGKPVWILLPLVPDWRWLLGREDSPWYPTARLFRQLRSGDWSNVVKEVAGELARLVGV